MSAIFGFTFQIGRMTEVLTPESRYIYIYIELTARDQKLLKRRRTVGELACANGHE